MSGLWEALEVNFEEVGTMLVGGVRTVWGRARTWIFIVNSVGDHLRSGGVAGEKNIKFALRYSCFHIFLD